VRGCHIKFPDTVFFEKGKPQVIIKSDKEDFLTFTTNPSRLKQSGNYVFYKFSDLGTKKPVSNHYPPAKVLGSSNNPK
jgi:hypothetical protein